MTFKNIINDLNEAEATFMKISNINNPEITIIKESEVGTAAKEAIKKLPKFDPKKKTKGIEAGGAYYFRLK